MKKLTCHCGGVEAKVRLPENGFEKLIRCNCSICKRKGFIMSFVGPDDLDIIKGKDLIKIYQFHSKTAKHFFCSKCGIHTHANPRSNPKIYMVNIACIDEVNPFEFKNINVNDGENHPMDKK
tara:strand:- start:1462 stop:1827 length:366 start_codon:yes stop_codon:yes gene_type:complete